MLAVVIKRGILVGGKEAPAGAIVETDGMRNVEACLRARHLRPASASEIAAHQGKTTKTK